MRSDSAETSKAVMRAAALARREALSQGQRHDAAQAIAACDFPVVLSRGTIVAGFSPIRGEIDPFPLMESLMARGATLALPVSIAPNQPLLFRAWTPGEPLVRGAYGVFEPSSEAEEIDPDIVLVPLAAFDRDGHRIGYGAGYYDRTLPLLRKLKKITAVGIAFAVQEIERVPSSEHDAQLDLELTDRETIDLRDI
jgi:5-formyltetrahydrofolate cyclo-ligase